MVLREALGGRVLIDDLELNVSLGLGFFGISIFVQRGLPKQGLLRYGFIEMCAAKPDLISSNLSAEDQARVSALFGRLEDSQDVNIGYPCNQLFDYSELFPLLKYMMNNLGDPYSTTQFIGQTHEFERDVIEFFMESVGLSEEEGWGYVTNGGTEGNMYGLFLARELFPEGIVYYAEHAHYSVAKILRLMNLRSIQIRSQPNGELDYEDLRESVKLHRDVPPIFFLNVGTTMTGAIDQVSEVKKILADLCLTRHYVHVDGALMGAVLPYCEDPPAWNFDERIVDSMSISGHKFIGSPIPCGVVLVRKKHVDRIARAVEYVGAMDTTIMGSRDAITPIFLWYAIRTVGKEGMRERVQQCLEMADYAVEQLQEAGIAAWRNEPSVTVVFPRPSSKIFEKWILAPHGHITHLLTMPHVTREIIDEFVKDMKADQEKRPELTQAPTHEPFSQDLEPIEIGSVDPNITE